MAINLGNIFFGIRPNTRPVKQAKVDVLEFGAALERLANISHLLYGPLSGVASRFNLLSTVTKKVGLETASMVAGLTAGAAVFVLTGKAALDAARTFEQVEMGLNAVYGASQVTGTQMRYLMDVSNRSGRAFDTVAKQYTRITAASKDTNLEGERTRLIFERILMAGSKMGSSNEEIAGTLRAVEQIMSKGTVQAEELRGQLGDRLPGAFNIMADALGMTTRELNNMMKQGQITADALLPFSEELARRYGVDLTQALDTVTSAEGRLANALFRFGKAADDAVGFTAAYKNTLDLLGQGLDFVSVNFNKFLKLLGTISAGLALMYAPAVISGFLVLANTIRMAAGAMLGLNAAVLANPLGALLLALTRLGLFIGGTILGMNLMNELIGDTSQVSSDADKAIRKNAEALKIAADASSLFRQELQSQIIMQRNAAREALNEASAQLQAARSKIESITAVLDNPPEDMAVWEGLWKIFELSYLEQDAASAAKSVDALTLQLKTFDQQLAQIDQMRKGLGEGDKPLSIISDPETSAASLGRMAKAARDAQQEIMKTRMEYNILLMSPGQQEFARMQLRINEAVQQFRDKLADAKLPLETVNMLTNQYRQELTALEEQQYRLEYFPDMWRELSTVLGQGMDQAMGTFVDSIIAGEDALANLMNIGRMVAADLIKTFAQLAVINPLKNILFGGNPAGGLFPTFDPLSFLGGGAGAGVPRMAGGGSFTIPHGGIGSGMDSQLVQFWGAPGEEVNISKRGQSADGGGGTTIVNNTYRIDARGAEIGVEEKIVAAIKAYDESSLVRQQRNTIRGRMYRIPGMNN